MRASLGVLAAALPGCFLDAAVGRVRAPDAPPDVAAAALDARDDVAPVGDPEREVTGLGSLAPTAAADPTSPSDHLRLYYVGRDGALWLERRAAATLARACGVSLGAPAGLPIVGRPGAGDRAGQVVVAPVRGEDGAIRLWARVEGGAPGPCGNAFSDWAPLPACPFAITSAPAVYQHPVTAHFPAENTYVLVATRVGLAMLRRPTPGAPWGAWSFVPGGPDDANVYGRPGLLEWGDQLHVWTLARSPARRPRLLHTIYFSLSDRWFASWMEDSLQVDDPPATAVDARAHFLRPEEPNQWLAYTGASGRLWTRAFHVEGLDAVWSTWRDRPAVRRGELAAPPSALSIGVARTTAEVAHNDARVSELVVVSTPPDGRRLHAARLANDAGAFGAWEEAPDALR